MNRQYEFRAWTGAKMEYDIMVGKFGAFYVNPGNRGDGLDENDLASLTPYTTQYLKDTPVMQYVGIKDKNDKKIFSGDLVRIKERGIYQVIYIENSMKFYFEAVDGDTRQFTASPDAIEIIGNIYEKENRSEGEKI